MFRRLILIVIFVMGVVLQARPQGPIRLRVTKMQQPDSADVARQSRPHFLRAGAEVVGLNTGLWAFDRYVAKGDYAYISLHTIRENLREGFKWDNDQMGNNMFMHPYHGNLYFNAARSNGYNFWQSGLFAVAGSAMWELFMECEYPSTNDIIATPIGGMAIGEVTYRASDIVLKDNTRGLERVGREIAGFLISPMRGFTRLVTGDAWRHRATTGRRFGIPNIAAEVSAGVRLLEFKKPFFDNGIGATAVINIEYGDRFEVKSTKPYDYFTFGAVLNMQGGQPLLGQLNIMGRLLAREFLEDRASHLSVGMYQHFDYFDSDTISVVSPHSPYKLGIPASVGCGVMFRTVERGRFALDAYCHANAVLLGGILSDYYKVDERNYNLASGFSVKTGLNFVVKRDRFSLSASHEYYRLFTWQTYPSDTDLRTANYRTINVQGDRSAATFAVTEFRGDLKLWRHLYLSAMFTMYNRSTHYREYPHIRSTTTDTRLMLTCKF